MQHSMVMVMARWERSATCVVVWFSPYSYGRSSPHFFKYTSLHYSNCSMLCQPTRLHQLLVGTCPGPRHTTSSICSTTLLNVRASFASDDGPRNSTSGKDTGFGQFGGTRLSRVLRVSQRQFLGKINEGRKKSPMKIFLVLLGYYAANALATILGQTGDWDVLVAGIVVAIIELIGSLMNQKSSMTGPFKGFLIMLNYWKAGFTLGLFVDAFKVGS